MSDDPIEDAQRALLETVQCAKMILLKLADERLYGPSEAATEALAALNNARISYRAALEDLHERLRAANALAAAPLPDADEAELSALRATLATEQEQLRAKTRRLRALIDHLRVLQMHVTSITPGAADPELAPAQTA